MIKPRKNLFILSMLLGVSCGDTTLIPPISLNAPTKFATIDDVCFSVSNDNRRLVRFEDCKNTSLKGSLAFIVNEQSDRVAMMQFATLPGFIDIDTTIPGTSHLVVGRLPVDISIAPQGAAAYVLNQLDRSVSVIDSSDIRSGKAPVVMDPVIQVPGVPIALETHPQSGDILIAYDSPSKIDIVKSWTSCTDETCTITPSEESKTLNLKGTLSDFEISSDGKIAIVSYRDLDRLSQITFDGTCLDPAQVAPCVEKDISLNFGCSDGIDNDGDGKIDAQDVQCFGPSGAESTAGNGRLTIGACADGEDNDGDGFTDRDDPECIFSHGQSEESSGLTELPKTPCNDGIDNDKDGKTDTEDPNCYGGFGRSESPFPQRGVDSISIDALGTIAYVVDRIHNEIKIINLQKGELIDVARSTLPSFEAFVKTPGVRVSSSPLDVSSVIFREVKEESIEYSFGAWVSIDNGQLQYLDAFKISCDLKSDTLKSEYITRLEDEEKDCIVFPSFPLTSSADRVLADDPALPVSCKEEGANEDYCQRAYINGNRVSIINPRLGLSDSFGNPGRAVGNRTCEQPPELIEKMEAYARNNPRAPQQFKCDSPLMPQPLSLTFSDENLDKRDLSALDRATIITRKTVLSADNIVEQSLDQSLNSENWVITFEGVIPGTSRSDGLFAKQIENASIDFQSGLDPCKAGVEVGDVVIITTKSTCSEFQKEGVDDYLSFEISKIQSNSLTLIPIEGGDFSSKLPTRSCFESGIEFEIRAKNAWTVVGDDTGMLSKNTSLFGECIPVFGQDIRRNGRVKTGERYLGPYLSFDLYEGFGGDELLPVRDLSFTFTVDRNFISLQYDTRGPFPSNVQFLPNVRANASYLVSTDPENDFIYLRNLQNSEEQISRLR